MTTSKPARSRKVQPPDAAPGDDADFPFADSVGYQIRRTHRALQRFLQLKIEPHGVVRRCLERKLVLLDGAPILPHAYEGSS